MNTGGERLNERGRSIEAPPGSSKNYVSHSKAQSRATRERIIEALANPTYKGRTAEVAKAAGVSDRTVNRHLASDPSIRREAREIYRTHYVPVEMLEVDRAMLHTAKTPGKDGNADRKLAYRVIDGIGDREDIGSGQELVVHIKCEDDFTGLATEVGVRIRPDRSGAP